MNNKLSFGIDLGTYNLKLFCKYDESTFLEKNVIAIQNKDTLLAYGDSAYEMYEKAPSSIEISFPLSCGVIADIYNMRNVIENFIKLVSKGNYKGADYYMSVPTDITEVEKRAFYDLIKESNLKPKNIYLMDRSLVNGVGLELDIKKIQGVFVIDVGYDTTEISTLSLGGIVHSKMVKVGGERFDKTIISVVKKETNLYIGKRTAENLRIRLSDKEHDSNTETIYGRDVISGLPMEKEISASIIRDALQQDFKEIVGEVATRLESTGAELSAEIYKRGVYLTGGASLTVGLAEIISDKTGLEVNTVDEPINTIVNGLSIIVNDPNYKSILRVREKAKGFKH